MTTYEVMSIVTPAVVVVGMGMLGWFMNQGMAHRREVLAQMATNRIEINERIDHLDACYDRLQQLVLPGLTKADLIEHRAEVQGMLTRMREAIANDTAGLERRLFRVEDQLFGGRSPA